MYYNVFGEKVSKRRFKEMCEAARNRRELITAELTSPRSLLKMGLLTDKGMLAAKNGLSTWAQTLTPQTTPTGNQTQTNKPPSSGSNPIPVSLAAQREKELPRELGQFSPGGTAGNHGSSRPWRNNNCRTSAPGIQPWGTAISTMPQARKEEINRKNVRAVHPELLDKVVVRCVAPRPMQGNNNPRTYSRLSG